MHDRQMRGSRENQHDSFMLNYLAIALAFTQEIRYEKCVEPSTLCFIRWLLTRGQLNLLYSAVFVSNAVRSPSTYAMGVDNSQFGFTVGSLCLHWPFQRSTYICTEICISFQPSTLSFRNTYWTGNNWDIIGFSLPFICAMSDNVI